MTHSNAVTLTITADRAMQLATDSTKSFLAKQPYRFDVIAGEEPDTFSNDGTLYWCEAAADLLFLEAYEQAKGNTTYLLEDTAVADNGGHDWRVLLSVEPSGSTKNDGPTTLTNCGDVSRRLDEHLLAYSRVIRTELGDAPFPYPPEVWECLLGDEVAEAELTEPATCRSNLVHINDWRTAHGYGRYPLNDAERIVGEAFDEFRTEALGAALRSCQAFLNTEGADHPMHVHVRDWLDRLGIAGH